MQEKEGVGGHGMNIKTSAVVKYWVRSGNSKPRASSVVPELCWKEGCPGRVGSRVLGGHGHCHTAIIANIGLQAQQEML